MSDLNSTLLRLRERLALTRYADRPRLARELDRLFVRKPDAGTDKAILALEQRVAVSVAQVERLRAQALRCEFDPMLPITAHREELAKALATNQVIVVCGATGSGKTTQLPKMCLQAGRGSFGLIGHTQPRRIAARAIAQRLAEELDTPLGTTVGFQVRFNDRTGADTRVKLMTDGILLRELEHDRDLRRYDTLIIDEAHERSLNIDFLFGVLKRILPRHPELRVIVTSATIDPQRFAAFFGNAPIIEVSGRSYPVEVRYRPLAGEADEDDLTLPEGIVAAVRELDHDERGDVLVFLPGEKQIRDAAAALDKARLHHTEVLPLYARLSARDQERVFECHSARRIVLATNVAETSLTVPDIRYVIDSGLARISRYSVRGKVQRLPIEPISRASADQRKGRCGRERAGICIRLYAEDEFALREEFTPPEVLRTNLASVILQMAALGLGEPENFPFLDPPDTRLINDGYRLLQELRAVDDDRAVTSLGRQIAALPLDPRLARMLVSATHHGCVAEMLILTAFLASQDPRERPQDAQQQADEKHAALADPRSDFMTVLKLWQTVNERSAELSGNQFRKWCRENFLSYVRLREWQELHRQLREIAGELELRVNEIPANYADLHQAILTGFLGGIGMLDEKREYEGARGSRFVIAPGTPLASKPPKWVVAASLMETTRLYARMVAAVEPQWIESSGSHLVRRTYSEPHWVEERGFVAAYESASLYGLTLTSRRRVNYGTVAAQQAQEIFVREALVEGHTRLHAPFLDHNRQLRGQIERMEAKLRRRDILVDEQALVDFYRARLPQTVNSTATLERWLKEHGGAHGAVHPLAAALRDFTRRDAAEVTAQSFPDTLDIAGNRLPLAYRFEPGAADDGVTITVPEPVLGVVNAESLAALIPGWRHEKVTALLRALPKSIRKSFVPVPDHVARALTELDLSRDFNAALAAWITREAGEVVQAQDLAGLPIADHLRFNIRIADLEGRVIAEGRDLTQLRRKVAVNRQGAVAPVAADTAVHRRWDFGELPREAGVERRGVRFTIYPTLRDHGDGVVLAEAKSAGEADESLRAAVLRLLQLALPEQLKYARKQFADDRDLILLGQGLSPQQPLAASFAERCFADCFAATDDSLPRSAVEFQALLDRHRGNFGNVVERTAKHANETLREWRSARQKLQTLRTPALAETVAEIEAQLQTLVPDQFPARVAAFLWPHLPRYLKALNRRLDKVAGNAKRDAELAAKVRPFAQELLRIQTSAREVAAPHPELDKLQWAIEEYRVSLFAQDLRTVIPVSDKRLAELVRAAQEELRNRG